MRATTSTHGYSSTFYRHLNVICMSLLVLAAVAATPAWSATHAAEADAYTRSNSRYKNFGELSTLLAQKYAESTTFVQFDIGQYQASSDVTSAQLLIPIKDVKKNGSVTIHRILGNWNETGITYGNQPRLGGTVQSFAAKTTDNNKVLTIDVTGLLRQMAGSSSGAYGIALKSSNGNVRMKSRESGAPIQLVVNGNTSGGGSSGGSGGSGGSGSGSGGTTNKAPDISGSPATSVTVDSTYSFRPTASDPNGDKLSFSISGKPSWASFDKVTGQLSGKPSGAHVGRYDNIGISVSDGNASDTLAPFYISVDAASNGRVTLSWLPPTQNTDGTALTNLRGYRINWQRTDTGATGSVTINSPGISSYVVDNLAEGRYRFTIAAVNTSSVASAPSGPATTTVY